MSDPSAPFTNNREPYVPATFSEIYNYLAGVVGYAPALLMTRAGFPTVISTASFIR